MDRVPRLVLWAWERPEDLRPLPPNVGVAFLAQSIRISPGRMSVVPRHQPLYVNPDASLVAVTRLDIDSDTGVSGDSAHVTSIAGAIAKTLRWPQVRALQVDFDARTSERAFYANLLRAIRSRIDAVPLSMTALASWCAGDHWIDGLPVDEAVPMLFEMGPTNEPFRRTARSGSWSSRSCRGSVGVSADEAESLRLRADRVYVFSSRSWTIGRISDVRNRFEP